MLDAAPKAGRTRHELRRRRQRQSTLQQLVVHHPPRAGRRFAASPALLQRRRSRSRRCGCLGSSGGEAHVAAHALAAELRTCCAVRCRTAEQVLSWRRFLWPSRLRRTPGGARPRRALHAAAPASREVAVSSSRARCCCFAPRVARRRPDLLRSCFARCFRRPPTLSGAPRSAALRALAGDTPRQHRARKLRRGWRRGARAMPRLAVPAGGDDEDMRPDALRRIASPAAAMRMLGAFTQAACGHCLTCCDDRKFGAPPMRHFCDATRR